MEINISSQFDKLSILKDATTKVISRIHTTTTTFYSRIFSVLRALSKRVRCTYLSLRILCINNVPAAAYAHVYDLWRILLQQLRLQSRVISNRINRVANNIILCTKHSTG